MIVSHCLHPSPRSTYLANMPQPRLRFQRCIFWRTGVEIERYSSGSYILAGLVLLGLAPAGQKVPATWSQRQALGPDLAKGFDNTFFPAVGPLPQGGLTTAGSTHSNSIVLYVRPLAR